MTENNFKWQKDNPLTPILIRLSDLEKGLKRHNVEIANILEIINFKVLNRGDKNHDTNTLEEQIAELEKKLKMISAILEGHSVCYKIKLIEGKISPITDGACIMDCNMTNVDTKDLWKSITNMRNELIAEFIEELKYMNNELVFYDDVGEEEMERILRKWEAKLNEQ